MVLDKIMNEGVNALPDERNNEFADKCNDESGLYFICEDGMVRVPNSMVGSSKVIHKMFNFMEDRKSQVEIHFLAKDLQLFFDVMTQVYEWFDHVGIIIEIADYFGMIDKIIYEMKRYICRPDFIPTDIQLSIIERNIPVIDRHTFCISECMEMFMKYDFAIDRSTDKFTLDKFIYQSVKHKSDIFEKKYRREIAMSLESFTYEFIRERGCINEESFLELYLTYLVTSHNPRVGEKRHIFAIDLPIEVIKKLCKKIRSELI
jgi:hypothetical protein